MESTDSSGGPPPPQPNLPPGFRFHPTDEELVIHYLKRKADSVPLPVAIIADVDLYKFDPWELPAKASFGEQEWYFFSPRDRKYPNGARPNRAATSGYWKATGTDKPVISTGGGGGNKKVGVKKALVFYSGKPPKGVKSDWIMHEYRLTDNKPNHICDFGNKKNSLRLDDWVLCRIYKKNNSTTTPRHHHHHHHHHHQYHLDNDNHRHDMMIDDDRFRHVPPSLHFPAIFSDNNDPTAIYDGGGGGNYSMNHNFASGSKQEQFFPPVMMMTTSINQDSGIGSSLSPSKRFNGGDCSNIVSSVAATPLMQNQGGIYQLPGLNWYS